MEVSCFSLAPAKNVHQQFELEMTLNVEWYIYLPTFCLQKLDFKSGHYWFNKHYYLYHKLQNLKIKLTIYVIKWHWLTLLNEVG